MAQRVVTRALQTRLYSAAASAQAPVKPLPASEVLVDKAGNGVQVASQEHHSSLARVVLAVKAGSRYEEAHQRGATHCLRVISDLTQKDVRTFRLTNELQQMAANVSCSTSREHILYSLEVPKNNLQSALPLFTGMAFNPSLRPWEISDSMPRLEYELLALTEQPEKRVVENIHSAAYREKGLGRSLYAPAFQISEFSPDMLMEYMGNNFTLDRVTLSGVGVDQRTMLDLANGLTAEGSSNASQPAKYFGGEARENNEYLKAFTVLVGEGASLRSDDLWAFAVLEQLLGSGPQVKWASNMTSNRMNSAIAQKTQEPFSVQAFNANYSDSGLFGVSAVTVPENSEVVIRTVVEQMKSLADQPVDPLALQGAKNRVKATIAFQSECPSENVLARAVELSNMGRLSDAPSTMSAIEGVTAAAVQSAAKKALASKTSMASVGELQNVPFVDDL